MAADHRTPCTYDEGCYRKKVSHYAEYAHPKKERKEREAVMAECAQSVAKITERKERMEKAANVCRQKKMAAAQKEFDESKSLSAKARRGDKGGAGAARGHYGKGTKGV